MGKRRLRDHMISRWDVVDAGDNPKSHILLFKEEGGISEKADVDKNGNTKKGEDSTMTLKEILAKLASEQSLTKEEQDFIKTETEAKDNEISTLKTDSDAKTVEIDGIKKDLDTTKVELDKVKKAEPGKKPPEEDPIKKASPEVQAEFKKMEERLEKADKEREASIKKVDDLSESIAKDKMVAKAKTLPGIAEDSEKLADLMLKISKALPEDYAEVEALLEKNNTAIVEGTLLKAVGSGEEAGSKKAESEIAKATEKMQKAYPDLTKEQAEEKALEENPELYTKYNEGVE